jgi:hypothetical protein
MTTDTQGRSGRDGDREGDQPLPIAGEGDVCAALIEKLKSRYAIGMERYGKPLQMFNGRDPFQDHEEELIDRHNYAEQIRLEYRALREAVMALGKAARKEKVSPDLFASAMQLAVRLEEVEARPRARPSPERLAEVARAVEAQRGRAR